MQKVSLTIDNHHISVNSGETILSAAKQLNINIPVLCFSKHNKKTAGCMICAVKELNSEKMLPACSAQCLENMQIDTCSEEVLAFRNEALQLILSEHRGSCEAPCTLVCPQGLNIPRLMQCILENQQKTDFTFDKAICDECQGKCEKVCNRKKIDSTIKIRELLFQFAINTKNNLELKTKRGYNHSFGKLSDNDLANLQKHSMNKSNLSDLQKEALRCLQCACEAESDCELRLLAESAKARQSIYKVGEKADLNKIIAGKIVYEPAKCIRCSRCVTLGKKINPEFAPVMTCRSKKTQISPPIGITFEQAFKNFEDEYVRECPTGALRRATVFEK